MRSSLTQIGSMMERYYSRHPVVGVLTVGLALITVAAHVLAQPAGKMAERPVVIFESNLQRIQKTLTGVVGKVGNTLFLKTADGVFRIRGLSLDETVGKKVNLTGVVKNNKEERIIYVAKAEIEE